MSTTRTSTSNVAFRVDWYHYNSSGVQDSHLSKTRNLVLTNTVTYGDNLPNWRELISAGRSATTTLVGTSYQYKSAGSGIYDAWSSPSGGFHYGHLVGDLFIDVVTLPSVSTSLDTAADNKARSKFLSKYLNLVNTWRGGNFLAEVRETIHMLRHPVDSLYRQVWDFAGRVGKLRKVYRRRPRSYATHLSDLWLAWSFGIKPLIADCNDAARALNVLKNGPDNHDQKVISAFGRTDSYSKSVNVYNQPVAGANGILNVHYVRYAIGHSGVRYLIAFKSAPADRSTALEQLGLGVFDVVPAVWEAIPWSFFVDYFLNVQEMIDSCRLWGVDFAWCNQTVRNSLAYTYRDLYSAPSASIREQIGGSPMAYVLAKYVNRAPSNVPFPQWHFSMPGLDSKKWWNIAALWQQIYASRP